MRRVGHSVRGVGHSVHRVGHSVRRWGTLCVEWGTLCVGGVLDFLVSDDMYKVSPGMCMHVAHVYQIELLVVFILVFLC